MKHESHAELAAALWPDKKDVPVKLLTCRHCGRRNRVQVPRAVLEPSRCECGACGQALFLTPEEPLTRLGSSAYEHSLDRSALAALKALPGFPALVRWLMSNLGERSLRLECLSSTIMCGDEQFPELVKLLEDARHGLDFPASRRSSSPSLPRPTRPPSARRSPPSSCTRACSITWTTPK
jgi:hypothetical protein